VLEFRGVMSLITMRAANHCIFFHARQTDLCWLMGGR
jgi:hypothetical protein